MRILDATCGEKEMWFIKNHPCVTFMDKRKGKYTYSSMKCTPHTVIVDPDVVSEWKDAPFPDETFDLILFDPPHIVQESKKGVMVNKYTQLNPDDWNIVLKEGIDKLFRILKEDGIFILKWDECSRKIDHVLKLFPYPPLFGTHTGLNNKNLWIVFLKHRIDKALF